MRRRLYWFLKRIFESIFGVHDCQRCGKEYHGRGYGTIVGIQFWVVCKRCIEEIREYYKILSP